MSSQSQSQSDYVDTPAAVVAYNTPPALIALTLTVLVVCFVAFSIIYLCKYCCVGVVHTWTFERTASGSLVRLSPVRSPPRGLEPSLLQSFPTFLYSSVKDLRKDKKNYSLECAICLFEFEDDSFLRLLTVCCHVFHQECIDLWLGSHKTCPVCRTDLATPVSLACDEVRLDVPDEEDTGDGDKKREQHEGDESVQRLERAHSTGHSIVMIRGRGGDDEGITYDDDKYTLRLPGHVIRAGHNCTRSLASYKDMEGPAPCSNCGFVQPVSASTSHAQQS